MAAVEPTSTQNFGKQPEPQAAPGTSTSYFEYRIEDYDHAVSVDDITAKLNLLGNDGWRLISFGMKTPTSSRAVFIREDPNFRR